MVLALIAGSRWAADYDLSSPRRSRLLLTMWALDQMAGTPAALFVGKRRARDWQPPTPPPPVTTEGIGALGEAPAEVRDLVSDAQQLQSELLTLGQLAGAASQARDDFVAACEALEDVRERLDELRKEQRAGQKQFDQWIDELAARCEEVATELAEDS